jgi:hypothetical protein
MYAILIKQMLAPVLRRIGTAVGAWLSAQQVPQDDANAVMVAIPVVVGILIDVLHSNFAGKWGLK